jgi:hypothetical protein
VLVQLASRHQLLLLLRHGPQAPPAARGAKQWVGAERAACTWHHPASAPSTRWARRSLPARKGCCPHLRGYVSRSMMTRFTLATQPWSHVDMMLVVICRGPEEAHSGSLVGDAWQEGSLCPGSRLAATLPV